MWNRDPKGCLFSKITFQVDVTVEPHGQFFIFTTSNMNHTKTLFMKKILLLTLIIGLSVPALAGLKEKHVLGTWSFTVSAGSETLAGTLTFMKEDGKLAGQVSTDQGDYADMEKVEIRDNNILYFEVATDYEVLRISLTIDKKKYTGKVVSQQGEMPIEGEKQD